MKLNIEKIQENNDKRISNEYEIQRQINENENLRNKIEHLQNTIDEQKEEINNLRDTIRPVSYTHLTLPTTWPV